MNDIWEFIVVYVDEIIAAMKDPQSFYDELQGPNVGFTMKGAGSPMYHLGADFFQDDDGTLCMGAQTYAKRLCATFESLYGEQPKLYFSLLTTRTILSLIIHLSVVLTILTNSSH